MREGVFAANGVAMSSPGTQGSLRQRTGHGSKKRPTTPNTDSTIDSVSDGYEDVKERTRVAVNSEWDYKLALAVITVLAFITRFYGISHPNQVVFDEVHFGKVWLSLMSSVFIWSMYLHATLVCVLLLAADVLLRRAPAVRKTALCICRLARWL
jgi:hypothetical protein